MQIQSINAQIPIRNRSNNLSFGGVLHIDRSTNNINDSWFFRDIDTLEAASEHLRTVFPEGANVLVYASSTGEENISLKALLPDSKYKVIGYDNSKEIVNLGKRGVYSLFSHWYDSFLLPNKAYVLQDSGKGSAPYDTRKNISLREKFNRIMKEIPRADAFDNINNKTYYKKMKYSIPHFVEKFYCIRDQFKSDIDLRLGNVLNVGDVKTQRPVGAVFFRNAVYHLCGNNIDEVLLFNHPKGHVCDKQLLFDNFVNALHKTIADDGIFVLGSSLKEHLFWADPTTPKDKKAFFLNTNFFNKNIDIHMNHAIEQCYIKSPLEEALSKKFIPISYSFVESFGLKVKVPTIWKKIRI